MTRRWPRHVSAPTRPPFSRRAEIFGLCVALASGLVVATGATASGAPARPAVPQAASIRGGMTPVVVTRAPVVDHAGKSAPVAAPKWPAAGTATIDLTAAVSQLAAKSATAGSAIATAATANKPAVPAAGGLRVHAAGSPVWAEALPAGAASATGAAPKTAASLAAADSGPATPANTRIQVQIQPHAAAAAAGIDGVVFTAQAAAGSGRVRLGVDYGDFAAAYGGNYGARLHLVALPACALTTPALPACRTATPLASANDAAADTVSAVAPVGAAAPTVLAATTASTADSSGSQASSGAGTYSATSLSPAGSWSSGGTSGSFTYTYPIQVPPAASKLVPTLNLAYDSAAVDGQTAATQAQADWAGDGWSTSTENFVEQSFQSCSAKPEGTASPTSTNDACYDGPILQVSLNGSSSSLIWDSAKSVWKTSSDNGEVVTHVTGANNGSGTYNTDYWTLTDRSGTVYEFGRNQLPGWSSGKPTTNSVSSEPVFSAHDPGTTNPNGPAYTDPCYNATWSQSYCTMAYRWNLDYVKDLHGNAMAYYYKQDTNYYGRNNGASRTLYDRDTHLDHIDYGFTDQNAYSAPAPDQIEFATGDRCLSGTCDPLNSANAPNWPDVPYDLNCASSGSCLVYGPTFWSTVRLTGITSSQYSTAQAKYLPVDGYALNQTLPPTGDGTASTLWLQSIVRTGYDTTAGGTISIPMPAVSFAGMSLANRVNTNSVYRYRITAVTNETGGVIGVDYELPYPCTSPVTVSPASNTTSCYPVYWTPPGYTAPILDWFQKYAVKDVTQTDKTAGATPTYTGYTYKSPAWHYDDNELVKPGNRTYGQFRGYQDVQTRTGQGNDPVTEQETWYYQGMSLDNNSTAISLKDSQGVGHDDANQLAGQTLETVTYTGDTAAGGTVDHGEISSYWVSPATASRTRAGLPAVTANVVEQVEGWSRQAITDGGQTAVFRKTESDMSYDTNTSDPTYGMLLYTFHHGDLAVPAQATCESVTYAAANTALNLVGLVAADETDAKPCGGTGPNGSSGPTAAGQVNALTAPASLSRPADVISSTQTVYDAPTLARTWMNPGVTIPPASSPPVIGDPSIVLAANDTGPGGSMVFTPQSSVVFDGYGRPTANYDANGHGTTVTYTTTAGLTTAATVTNQAGQQSKTTTDPMRGLPLTTTDQNNVVTTQRYDALGRLTGVWEYGRPTTSPANLTYTYQLSNTAPTVIASGKLNESLGYVTMYQIYDSLLRLRQTQAPTPAGGDMYSDVFYDSHGWVVKENNPYWDKNSTPSATLQTPKIDSQIPDQTVYTFDGQGRAVTQSGRKYSQTVETKTTVYNGDRTTTIPPAGSNFQSSGGTVTSMVTDALGRTTELDQYTSAPALAVPANTVTGVYSVSGGSYQATAYTYDHRGRPYQVTDSATPPDVWTTTYDLLGRVTGNTDPDSGTSSRTYDAAGNMLSETDARGKTVSSTYDQLNRRIASFAATTAAQAPANETASWTYDGPASSFEVGKLVSSSTYVGGNVTGGLTYTQAVAGYNVFGEATGTTVTIPSSSLTSVAGGPTVAGQFTFSNTYSANTGLLSSNSFGAAAGLPREGVSHSYIPTFDLPTSLGGASPYTQSVSYDAFSRVAQQEIGTTSTPAYLSNLYDDHTGALTDSHVDRTTLPSRVDDVTYTYDNVGDVLSQTDTRMNSTSSVDQQCYQYDTLDRLHQAWTATDGCAAAPFVSATATNVGDTAAPSSAYWTSWEFDTQGQRKSETQHSLVSGTADTATTYQYGATGSAVGCQYTGGPHTLTGTSTTGPSGSSSSTACYDQDGDTVSRTTPAQGQQSFTWDEAGRMTATTTGSSGSSYTYDADGQVLLRSDGGVTTLYLPGEELVLDTNAKTLTGTRFYDLPGGGQAVRTSATGLSFEFGDQHGTQSLSLDSTAQIPTWRQFTPYGAPRGPVTSWADQHGFLDKAQDTTTGLTIVGARQYDPVYGRFISLDPKFEASSPQQFNGYTYAASNPTTGSDPSGLDDWWADPSQNPGVDRQVADDHGYGANCAKYGCTDPQPCGSACQAHIAEEDFLIAEQAKIDNFKKLLAQELAKYQALEKQYERSQCPADPTIGLMCEAWSIFNSYTDKAQSLFMDAQPWLVGAIDCFAESNPMTEELANDLNLDPGDLAAADRALLAEAKNAVGSGDVGTAIADEEQLITTTSKQLASAQKAAQDLLDCLAPNSFTGDTRVLMADGTSEPISRVKAGDKIADADPGAAAGTADQVHTVTAVHVTHTDRDFTDVTIATPAGPATIAGTAHHPYWDATTRSWTDADRLRAGERVQTDDGLTVLILAVRDYTAVVVTYNLSVDGLHTYFVEAGATPVLVHNAALQCKVLELPLKSVEEAFHAGRAESAEANFLDHYKRFGMPAGMTQQEYFDSAVALQKQLSQPGRLPTGWNKNLNYVGFYEDQLRGFTYSNASTGQVLITTQDGQIVSYHP